MSLLEFINAYEPVTKPIDDIMTTFNHIISNDDERDKEDIRPLHSGQPETDSEGSASGVQEEGVEVPGVSLCDNA